MQPTVPFARIALLDLLQHPLDRILVSHAIWELLRPILKVQHARNAQLVSIVIPLERLVVKNAHMAHFHRQLVLNPFKHAPNAQMVLTRLQLLQQGMKMHAY